MFQYSQDKLYDKTFVPFFLKINSGFFFFTLKERKDKKEKKRKKKKKKKTKKTKKTKKGKTPKKKRGQN